MQLPNPSEIRKLWDLLPHPRNTVVRWFARNGDERQGGGADNVDELILSAEACAGMNFYVAPNPASTRAGTRHRAEQVTHWSWFLMDIDPVEPVADPGPVVDYVLGKLWSWTGIDFERRRPLIINSGRGMQIWVRLPDVPLDETDGPGDLAGVALPRLVARVTNGWWLNRLAEEVGTMNGCRIDTTCADLPRVMRCPGTVNQKTGRYTNLTIDSSEVFEELPRILSAAVPPELFEPQPIITLPEGTPWQHVFVHLTLRAQDYLTYGKEEPGRHDTMFHVALTLAEAGLPRDEVRRALQYGNDLWDRQHPAEAAVEPRALKPKDIEHALDTAFRRLLRDGKSGTLVVEAPAADTAAQ